MRTARRFWKVFAVSALLLLGTATAAGAVAWYLWAQSVEAAQSVPLHAPGTYFFAGFTGGVMGPFEPREEISFDQATARAVYCIGTYDNYGRLIAIEKRGEGRRIFLFRYGYGPDGKRDRLPDEQSADRGSAG